MASMAFVTPFRLPQPSSWSSQHTDPFNYTKQNSNIQRLTLVASPSRQTYHPLLSNQTITRCTAAAPPTTEHRERSATFLTTPFSFYRPTSQLVRDLGVLALSALPSHSPIAPPYTVLDGFSASGIRSLRYLQPPCHVSVVHANDTHSSALHSILLSNLSSHIHTGRAVVTNLPAERLLRDERHDLVDLDAFGTSGEPLVGLAVDGVQPHGLLYLCATDAVAGAGRNKAVAYAAYGATTSTHPAVNEQFLRLVVGAAHRAALARGRAIRPVFAYFHRRSSTARVMLQLDAGEPSLDGVGFLRHCLRCGQNGAVPLEIAGSAYMCPACGAANGAGSAEDVVATGPTWIGALQDGAFLNSMKAVAEGLHAPGDDWGKAMRVVDALRDEAELPPAVLHAGRRGEGDWRFRAERGGYKETAGGSGLQSGQGACETEMR